MSSWILETIGPRMAYLAGWTYWIVHMPYISQKPNGSVIAASWAIFRDARISQMNVRVLAVDLSGAVPVRSMGCVKRNRCFEELTSPGRFYHVYYVPVVYCYDDCSTGYYRSKGYGY